MKLKSESDLRREAVTECVVDFFGPIAVAIAMIFVMGFIQSDQVMNFLIGLVLGR